MPWAVPEVCKRQQGSMHVSARPVMHTGCPAYPLARQRLAASPHGRPWRGSGLGRGGERPQGHRCPVRARGHCAFSHARPRSLLGSLPLKLSLREGGLSAPARLRIDGANPLVRDPVLGLEWTGAPVRFITFPVVIEPGATREEGRLSPDERKALKRPKRRRRFLDSVKPLRVLAVRRSPRLCDPQRRSMDQSCHPRFPRPPCRSIGSRVFAGQSAGFPARGRLCFRSANWPMRCVGSRVERRSWATGP